MVLALSTFDVNSRAKSSVSALAERKIRPARPRKYGLLLRAEEKMRLYGRTLASLARGPLTSHCPDAKPAAIASLRVIALGPPQAGACPGHNRAVRCGFLPDCLASRATNPVAIPEKGTGQKVEMRPQKFGQKLPPYQRCPSCGGAGVPPEPVKVWHRRKSMRRIT